MGFEGFSVRDYIGFDRWGFSVKRRANGKAKMRRRRLERKVRHPLVFDTGNMKNKDLLLHGGF